MLNNRDCGNRDWFYPDGFDSEYKHCLGRTDCPSKEKIHYKACDEANLIYCVCDIVSAHIAGCKFRTSATCKVPIECKHNRDVCEICDPCTCEMYDE